MQNSDQKHSAICLLIGSFLMIVTMILHPVSGGSIEGLIAISTFAIVAHSIAIASVPINIIGFYGVYRFIGKTHLGSKLAFSFVAASLIAAGLAATINGLALPLFVLEYRGASPEIQEALKPILKYSTALNHSFDYILIVGMLLSVGLWSLVILMNKMPFKGLGWLGVILVVAVASAIVFGFYFLDLGGFRIFIFGWVAWIVWMAMSMLKHPGLTPTATRL